MEAIQEAVKAGFGFCLVPASNVEHDISLSTDGQLVVLNLNATPYIGDLYVVRDRRRYVTSVQRALLRNVTTGLLRSTTRRGHP